MDYPIYMETSELKRNLGKNIKFYRKLAGYTQDKFAAKIDVAVQTLSSIETGVSFPNSINLCKILNGLNISTIKLFSFIDDLKYVKADEVEQLIVDKIKLLDKDKKELLAKYIEFLLQD